MNARCFKTVFSKRLGARVAVGEHASSQGKATGAGGFAGDASQPGAFLGCVEHQGDGLINGFWGVLSSTFALVALVWATPAWAQPAPNALPTGGQVVQGAVQFNQSAQQLNITQSTDRAAVNWQSFDIGVAAKVNIQQPSAQSVLLNRVGGESPSQIFGQLQANGKVILVNPNGLVIGRDGSVSAAGFTGSTLNISDADFMAGHARFSRSGAGTGSVLNQGRIEVTRGAYVALLGASVSNEGAIVAPQGHVFLAAADGVNIPAELPGPGLVGVPLGSSGRIRLELTPASINAAVANHKGGTIVTEGGQVYLQAAALNQAMATVLQSGSIDTSGVQGGQVHVLADGGTIKVNGSITANSSGTDDKGQTHKGGDIFIGRDEETGVLAKATDASGAKLESLRGFVETSGHHLVTTGTRVKAAEWLLDPTNITIAASSPSGTAYANSYSASVDSVILASDIATSLNGGTSVTIATTASGSSAGNIAVNASIAKTSGGDASLTLRAHNDIVVAANSTITSTVGRLNVVLNSDFDGNGIGAIAMASGSGITSFGGHISLGGGTAGTASDYATGHASALTGVSLVSSSLNAGGGNISIKGRGITAFTNTSDLRGVNLNGATVSTSGAGSIVIDGLSGNANVSNLNVGIGLVNNATITAGTGAITLTGSAAATTAGGYYNSGIWVWGSGSRITGAGAVSLTGVGGGSTYAELNQGVRIEGGQVRATGTGTLTLNGTSGITSGTAGPNAGIEISANGLVATDSGNISITGLIGTAGSTDVLLQTGGSVTSSSGNITFTGNSYSGDATVNVNAVTGIVTLQNRTAGILLDVGGTSADVTTGTLKLGISSAELARIAAATIVVGRNDATATGNTTINATNMGALGNTSGNLTLVSGGDLLLAQNQSITKSTGSEATLTMRANGDINLWNGSSISSASNKLNVVLNSDADANNAGAVRLILSSITSNGGNITMGGGVNAAGYASGSGTLANGIWFNGSNLFSGGGNIALKGRSSASTNSDGGASAGIWFRDEAATIDINAGSGTITMDGLSQSTHASAHTHGVMVGGFGTRTTIQSSSSAAKAIDITGVGSASSPNASGIWINGTASMLSTGTGGISLDGTDRSATGAGETAGVFFKNGRVLSASGQIHITGASQAVRGIEMNWADGQGGIIGSQSGSAITSSSANIVLNADSMRLGTTALSAINTSGTVTLQNRTAGTLIDVGGTSSDVMTVPRKLGISADELARITASTIVVGRRDAAASGNVAINAINMGGLGNSSSHLTVLGQQINVNDHITKTAGSSANLSLIAENNISVAASRTISASSGALNVLLNANASNSGGAIVLNSGAGITSNGGNITLGGGSTLNGSGFATADGVSTLQGISLNTATISAGGGHVVMNGLTPITSATNVVGLLMAGGSITTTGAGLITLTGRNQLTGTTGGTGTGLSMSSGTITGGSTGALTIEGDSRPSAASSINNKGAIINGTVTSTGGNIGITGFGGAGAHFSNGIDIGGSVVGVGSANINIAGTGSSGSSGGNVGVTTSGAATVSSVNGNINITGTGGVGNGTTIRNHGVAIIGSQAIASSGTGNITIKGTATNIDNGFSEGVRINSGGVTTNTGSINIDGEGAANYQTAVFLNAAIRSTAGGNVYVRSSGANISNTSAGAISGNNVSIDNSNGSIDSMWVITPGSAGTRNSPSGAQPNGVTINGAITATNNLRINGRNTHNSATDGAGIATGAASITAQNMYLVGTSAFGNGIKVVGSTLSSHYYNVHGTSTSGVNGVAIQSSIIKTTGTTGFSTESIIKGTSTAIPTNGYGAFMGYLTNTVEAATGTKLTLLGEGTTPSAGANTKERGFFLQNGYTLNVSGDITLEGTSNSGEGVSIGGTINMTNVAGVTNQLTIRGTAAASSNSSLNALNMSGVINSNASTSSINLIGDARNLSGTSWDRAIFISGAINGGTSNVNIQSTGANITTSAAITGANISIDNTNGSIHASTGAITAGSGTAGSAVGIELGSTVTATGNLNVFGASAGNIGLRLISSASISGGNIQTTGRTTNGANGVLLNGSNAITTTGTSGASLVRGITTNGGTHALLGSAGLTLTAASGSSLTLWGDGTSTTSVAASFDGGVSNVGAIINGAVTLRGTSNNQTALMLTNGAVTANANSALTLQGTTSGAGRNGVETVTAGGVNLSNGASVSIDGQNTASSGAGVGINLNGNGIGKATGATTAGLVTLNGSSSSSSGATGAFLPANITSDSSITITGNVTSAASTGVSIAGAVVSTGTGTTIGVSSNQGITGTGAIGSTTFRNANVTFTQTGTSTYSGAINAANFTKAGAGSLTLDSWVATTPANTNISNAYTVSSGTLSLSPHMNYAGLDPASVNVVNNATFSLSNAGNGFWRNTAFNFTGGQGGGTMNLLGNPIGISNTTNTFSTSGGATNTINGLLNANNANVSLNLAVATSGTTLLDGSFAALVFAQNAQGGFGLDNATTINTNGPGGLLFLNRVKATQLNVNSGTVQFGNGSAATAAATPELQATNVAIASGAQLILNRAEAQSNASVFTGAGSLTQAGAGTLTLTGNSSGFAGGTTVNAGRSLVIGTNGNLGAAGSTLNLASSTSSVGFTNTAGTSTIGSVIRGEGSFSKSGAGTGVLTANNTYTGTTTVSGGTLQVGNGGTTGTLGTGGAVTLSNNAVLSYVRSADTTIANNISGTGSVSASITGAGSDLAVSHSIALTAGTVNLAADGHLSLTQGITTSNATDTAIVLNAGATTNAGTSSGGDISFTGSGAVSVGAGGRATLFTGSLSGSTGLGITSGNNRYNSDELTTNYTAALGNGTFAIYREAPTLSVRFNDASKTYDALAFTGGNGLSVVSGLVNGDTSTTFSGISYSGTAQNATNAGTYAISGTAINSHGYALSYTNGTLTVNKANLVLTGTRTYDAGTTFAGQHLTATGVAGQTFSLTGSGHSSNLASKHVANNQNVALSSVNGLSLGASSNGGLAANYNDLSTAGSSVSVSAKTASVNATPTTVTYSGVLQTQNALTSVGFIAGDAVTLSGLASGIDAGTYASNIAVNGADAGNYTIGITNANLVVQKANLVLSGSRAYDGGTTFAGAFLTAAGVNNETFAVTGLGDHSNLTYKNVAANQAVALNSVTGLALGSSSNGGLSTNYNALSTAGSSVSLSLKSASVTGNSTQLVYNGQVQTQQAATTSGFVGGDVITVSGLASGKNAGTYTSQLLVGGADAANYSVAYHNANLVIGKASLTATANSSTVTYNAETQSVAGFTVTGLLGSDQLSDLTGLSASGASGTQAGSYNNFMTSGAQTNYVVNAINGTLTINKAPLTVTGHSASVTYNGFDQLVSGFSVSGLKGNDTVNSLSTVQATGAIGKNAGVYTNTVEVGTENNYTVTAVNGTLTIGKAALTATGNSAQVTYNGASQSVSGFTLTGLLGADTAADITQVSASGASGTHVGGYVNTVTAGTETNYTVTPVNGFLSIGKANLILSGSRVYDRTTSFAGGFLTASGVAGQTFSVSGAGDASNLASKNVQSSQSLSSVTGLSLGASTNGGLSSNYNALSTTGSSVSVTPLSASVSGTAASVVYNGSTQNQAVTSSGFMAGDDVVISGWASGKDAGTYGSSLSLTGADAANYSVTFNNANWVVTPAPLVVTATAVTKTYDGKLKATGTGTVGVLAGAAAGEDVLSAGVQSFLDKDAGTGKTVRASGVKIKDASGRDVTVNYAINYVDNTSSTINKAMLTITANNDARFVTQSDAVGFNGVSYTGLVYGETSSVLGGSLSIARTNAATQDAGNYSGVLVPSGLTSNNYQISFANGDYWIVPAHQLLIRTVNLTGSNSVVYGSAINFDATAQYLDGSNEVIYTLSRTGSNGLFTFSDGANGAVSVALKPYIGSNLASTSNAGHTVVGNYAIRDLNPLVTGGVNFSGSPVFVGALQVDPRAVTPNATGVAKTYDGTTSMNNLVVGLTGKMGNDDLSISGSGAFSQKHVGTGLRYTISDVALSGADAANYYLMGASNSFSGNDGVITRAPLVISTANVVKTYDRTPSALGQAVAVQGTQLFSGDSFSGGTFAFTNANAGSGNKTVTVSGVAVNDGNGGGNYSISFANNTSSTIQARALQANFAASSKVYDGTTLAQVTGNTADVIAGDTVFLVKTGAVFNDKNVGAGKSVTVSGISLSGADAANYSLQNTSALSSADITPKPLTASFSTSDRAYDGSTTATVLGSSTDKVAGDNLVFNAGSAHFASADAGANKQVTLTGLSLGGADAGNYALQNTSATSTGTINLRDVSLTGLTAANKVYDGTTSAVISSGVIATGVSGESLSVTGTGAFASKLVGNNKSVTVADVSALTKVNGTGHWNNYRLVTTGSLSTNANITPAPLTVTANAVNKTYDGLLTASGSGTVGALAGAGDSVSSFGVQSFLDKNVGIGNKVVRASGVSIKDAANADMTGNYQITYVDSLTGSIVRAPLTIKINNTSMFVTQVPDTAVDNGFTVTGFVNGENSAYVLGPMSRRYTGAFNVAAGNYAGVFDLSAAPLATNYSVSVQKGDLTVVPADMLLVHLGSGSEAYGVLTAANAGSAASNVMAQYCLVASDCNGANIANLAMTRQGSRWTATDASNSTISFDTAVNTSGRLSAGGFVNAGHYVWAASGLTTTGALNFNGTAINAGVLTVNPKLLSLGAGNVTKVYDGSNALVGRALTPDGAMPADSINVVSTGGSFAGKSAGQHGFTLTGLKLQGADRANYGLAGENVTGTGLIIPKALQWFASVEDKVYDGNTSAVLRSLALSGIVDGDHVNATGGTAHFASKNVARDAAGQVQSQDVTVSGVVLTGASASNYSLLTTSLVTRSTITPRKLSVIGTQVADKIDDGSVRADVRMGALSGLVGAEQLRALASGQFRTPGAGQNKPVDVLYSLQDGENGGKAGNYELVGQTLKASITPVNALLMPRTETPIASDNTRLRVLFDQSRWASFAPAQSSNGRKGEVSVDPATCSVQTPSNCSCNVDMGTGLEICLPARER